MWWINVKGDMKTSGLSREMHGFETSGGRKLRGETS